MKHSLRLSLLLLAVSLFPFSIQAETDSAAAADLATQAKAALESGATKDAISLLEKAIELDPENASLHTRLAGAFVKRIDEVNFMMKGMIAGQMLKAYQTSVEVDPDHLEGYIGLCRYYLNAPPIAGGSADKAEIYAKEVHARLPWLGEVELALVAEKRGDAIKAAEHFRTALTEQPHHGEALAGLKRVTASTEPTEG